MAPTSDLTSPPDPAGNRGSRLGAPRTLLGLFGAPAAWLVQLALSEPLAAYACYPYQAPLSAPIWEGLPALLAAINLTCLGVGLASGCVVWRSWQLLGRRPAGAEKTSAEPGEDRSRFLIRLSLMSSFIFIVAAIFNVCAVLWVPLCDSGF
jgi:hypothetical protein